PFHFEPLPFGKYPQYQPNKGTFAETFVLNIPNGRVSTSAGYVVIDEKYMLREFYEQCQWLMYALNLINHWSATGNFSNVRKVSGRVAVISRRGYDSYVHGLVDVLGRLAIIELMGIDYDYLYIPYESSHIKDIIKTWGIDPLKMIQPGGQFNYIQADELIVPSFTSRLAPTPGETFHSLTICCGVYWPTWLVEFYRKKFLPLVAHKPNKNIFSKKVFISRKDRCPSVGRGLINEDEVFKLLQKQGFERYVLSQLSFLQQVELFNNADVIVGTHGAGFTNILFCKPGAKVFEIFQARSDTSFFYLAQLLDIQYKAVQTMEFPDRDPGGGACTAIPLEIIHDILNNLNT
ncbi:MAG TPA: glycosyltransferase family 61 protein, partial [Candidatus Saccharimonadales bacterium]|nr:glycosyltransferase family 61 protein [Candidatus Saccharimonadales bacterium]